jgi:RNA polymerase sigma factor (sigma-70 family)
MVGLNLEELFKRQERISMQMRVRDCGQFAEDACQEYALRLLEGKSKCQRLDYFCIDYIRKHFEDNRKPNQIKYASMPLQDFEKSLSYDGVEHIENQIDYRVVMNKILSLKNVKQRRVLVLYFFSGLSARDIAKREGNLDTTIHKIIYRALKTLKLSILSEEQAAA